MLLQTVKSRNLWLWGEIVQPAASSSERDQLLTEYAELQKKFDACTNELVVLDAESPESLEAKELHSKLAKIQEERGAFL